MSLFHRSKGEPVAIDLTELKDVVDDVKTKAEAAFKVADTFGADLATVVSDLRAVAAKLEAYAPVISDVTKVPEADVDKVADVVTDVANVAAEAQPVV